MAILASAVLPSAQEAQPADLRGTTKMVVLRVIVNDASSGRFIKGLRATDFLIFEDDILQTPFSFAEGRKPLLPVSDDGVARMWVYPQPLAGGGKSFKDKLADNTYSITYYPDHSNRNDRFRRIRIEVVPDVKKKWIVRHMPGYLP
jgi:hypothetical protein